MAELAYLGSLLGLPNMLDPSFPVAFSNFFTGPGAANPAAVGSGVVDTVPRMYVKESNVSVFVCLSVWYACM